MASSPEHPSSNDVIRRAAQDAANDVRALAEAVVGTAMDTLTRTVRRG